MARNCRLLMNMQAGHRVFAPKLKYTLAPGTDSGIGASFRRYAFTNPERLHSAHPGMRLSLGSSRLPQYRARVRTQIACPQPLHLLTVCQQLLQPPLCLHSPILQHIDAVRAAQGLPSV